MVTVRLRKRTENQAAKRAAFRVQPSRFNDRLGFKVRRRPARPAHRPRGTRLRRLLSTRQSLRAKLVLPQSPKSLSSLAKKQLPPRDAKGRFRKRDQEELAAGAVRQPTTVANMSSLRLNLPPWDSEDPVYWFKRVKGAFKLCKDSAGSPAAISAEDKLSLVGNVLPADIMKEYKDYVMKDDFDGFEKAVCGAAAKTDTALFKEIMAAKLQAGQTPSKFVQQQKVRLGMLSEAATCKAAACTAAVPCGSMGPCPLMNWILKSTLEDQLPDTVKSTMADVPFDGQSYLNKVDKTYATVSKDGDSTTAAVSADFVEAIDSLPVEFQQVAIAAFRKAGGGRVNRGSDGGSKMKGKGGDKADKRCQAHRRFGSQAYTCGGGDCPDRGKKLKKRPTAAVEKDNDY